MVGYFILHIFAEIIKNLKDMDCFHYDKENVCFRKTDVNGLLFLAFLCGIIIGLIISLVYDIMADKPITIPKEECEMIDTVKHTVTATCYRATIGECDSTPLITADGSKIDTNRVDKLRWCAISRDLEKHYNMGDTIMVSGIGEYYDGLWVIHDRMAKRWKQKIDFLISDIKRANKFENVCIYKK